MRFDTKIDQFIKKMISCTSKGLVPWEAEVNKLGYASSFTCELKGTRIQILLVPENSQRILISPQGLEDTDSKGVSVGIDSPYLSTLVRAVRDFLFIPWSVTEFVENFIEGEVVKDDG